MVYMIIIVLICKYVSRCSYYKCTVYIIKQFPVSELNATLISSDNQDSTVCIYYIYKIFVKFNITLNIYLCIPSIYIYIS